MSPTGSRNAPEAKAREKIDALLVQEELPAAAGTNAKTENLREVDRNVAKGGKPIAIVSMISYPFTEHTRAFRADLKNLPVLQEVEKSLKAVAAAGLALE